jgi:hypothetical protein
VVYYPTVFYTLGVTFYLTAFEKKACRYDEKSSKQNTDIFYDTFLSYFEKRDYHLDDLKIFRSI